MAQTVNLRLSRADNSPWGFRLQGGKDFGQPLLIQKVNGGSIAERAGLLVGDAVIRVNNVEVGEMRHKDAQDTIVRAGNSLEIAVQRGGGSTWRPQVSPVGHVPLPGKASPATTVTKTSLAAGRSPAPAIGSGHNLSPKPFSSSPQMNGDPSVKAIVNKQYNTPVQMYSEETIAETLSAQAEVLAGGAIGVNFMKNEKTYDSQKSEVFKMVQEVEKEPREVEQPDSGAAPITGFGLRHVQPPEPKPATTSPQPQQLPPGQNICADCERLIVGVFVRIKDKNLHVECFKCATCGTSLKNVGYYTINNKLYCDIHAKMVARQNPPAPNLEPVTVPPGSRVPASVFSSPQISVAPQSPQPGTLAPLPFHAPRTTTSHVVPPRFGRQTSAPSGPKPFGSVTAPSAPSSVSFTPSSIAPPPSVPFSSVSAPPPPSSISKPFSDSKTPVVWPPSAQSFHQISQESCSVSQAAEKRLSICSEEVSSIASRKLDICSSILEEERPSSPIPDKNVKLEVVEKSLIEAGERVKRRSMSPRPPTPPRSRSPQPQRPITPRHFRPDTPDLLDISSKPHGIHSLLPPACTVRPLTPKQVVVFPPEFPTIMYSRSPTPRREKKSPDRCTTCPSPLNAVVPYQTKDNICQSTAISIMEKSQNIQTSLVTEASKHVQEQKLVDENKNVQEKKSEKEQKSEKEVENKQNSATVKSNLKDTKSETCTRNVESEQKKFHDEKMFYSKSEVEKIIHEEVLKALALKEDGKADIEEVQPELSVHDLPKPIAPSGWMTSALTTASERPFTPVPFPKAMELPSIAERIIPMEPMKVKKDEKPVSLPVETQPYFPPPPPPPGKEGLDDRTARALREVGCRSPLTEALTTAPARPYSPLPTMFDAKASSKSESVCRIQKKEMSLVSALTTAPTVPFTMPGKTPIPTVPDVKVEDVEKTSAFKPVHPKPFNLTQKSVEKCGIDLKKIATQGHTKETVQCIETGKLSKSTLGKNNGERNRSISPVPHPIVASSIKPTPTYIPQPPKPKPEVHVSKKEESKQSEKAEFLQTKKGPARPTTPSGLHPPGELPYYQQNIGVIPIRNKAISPTPHVIKAPQIEIQSSSQQQQLQQAYKSTVYSETKTYSAQKSSSVMATKNITSTKETPISGRASPQVWKLETKRTVQNLSPITVRLQSPRPATPSVHGETEQAAKAKVQIHRPRPSSPLPPTVKVKVEYPPVTSSGPVIGSEKSAFASVKNGSSTQVKKDDVSSSSKQSCSKDSSVCSKQTSSLDSNVCTQQGSSTEKCTQECEKTCESSGCESKCQKSQQANKSTSQASTSASTASSAIREQSTSQQSSQRAHSGITSFRAYGETSKKTITGDEYGETDKHHQLKLEAAKMSKTFEKKEEGKMQISSTTRSEQRMSKQAVEQKSICSASAKKCYSECTSEQKSLTTSTAQKCHGSSIDQRHSGMPVDQKPSQKSSILKSNLPANKSAIGDKKPNVGFSPCPLPTFPSLPTLSDVTWTPGAGGRTGTFAGSSAPKRGRGILNQGVAPGARIPLCGHCNMQIRGPFITALGKIWCPDHFVCVNGNCRRPLQDIGFVEEPNGLYCEFCYEQYLAPTCDKCNSKIKGDCLNAIGKHFHPECFSCAYCGKLFGNNPFFLEDALPYCENDWNELFTTKCFSCGFPIEAGDRWVEALNNNYHSQCFNCTMCKKNLEGQSFFAKAGRPFCKNHAR